MNDSFVVKTSHGPVRGIKRTSHVGEEFLSFRGIPYARPPIGALRFKDPLPPTPWVLPLDATMPGNIAMAVDKLVNFGTDKPISKQSDEDCLKLNVYTKNLSPGQPRPVMVWIHGGGFKTGSADESLYGPDYLLQHDVVYVSINYRLGAFGFLSITDPSVGVPGNAGLKDQTLALRWVRQNAAAFGGDAANVTIFGESAGGASVHFHMVSELSRGLFDRAIAQSGTVLCPWVVYPNTNWAGRLAQRMGWTGEGGPRGAYDFLKEADAADIVRSQDDLADAGEQLAGVSAFGPVPEPYRSEQTFFEGDVAKLVRRPWSRGIPLLIGGNADEGLLFWQIYLQNTAFLQSAAGATSLLPATLVRRDGGAALLQRVVDFYHPGGAVADDIRPLSTMWGDRHFWHGIVAVVDARLQHAADDAGIETAAPTYLYRFAKDSRRLNQLKLAMMGVDVPGVCHGDELLYLFRPQIVGNVVLGSDEEKTIARMTAIWTRFAATGRPELEEPTDGGAWEPVKAADGPAYRCLEVNDELRVIGLPEAERVAFWNDVLGV